jgi:hypothetical protein
MQQKVAGSGYRLLATFFVVVSGRHFTGSVRGISFGLAGYSCR